MLQALSISVHDASGFSHPRARYLMELSQAAMCFLLLRQRVTYARAEVLVKVITPLIALAGTALKCSGRWTDN